MAADIDAAVAGDAIDPNQPQGNAEGASSEQTTNDGSSSSEVWRVDEADDQGTTEWIVGGGEENSTGLNDDPAPLIRFQSLPYDVADDQGVSDDTMSWIEAPNEEDAHFEHNPIEVQVDELPLPIGDQHLVGATLSNHGQGGLPAHGLPDGDVQDDTMSWIAPPQEEDAEYDHPEPQLHSIAGSTLPRELVIVDSSVTDLDAILADIHTFDTTRERLVLELTDDADPFEQIDAFLGSQSNLSAIHLVSHGTAGKLALGDALIDLESLDQYTANFESWRDAFTEDGDLLIYGCNIAETSAGEALLEELAELTGADVAASDNQTGHASLGGDWVLEYTTGEIETIVAIAPSAQAEFVALLGNAAPSVTVAITGSAQPGQNATINLSFNNAGLPGNTGFGPFIDVLIPKLGADGIYDGDTTGDGSLYNLFDVAPADGQADGEPDGLILPPGMTVTYQGLELTSYLLTFGDDDGAGPGTTGTIAHPFAVDNTGTPLSVVGQAGDQLLVIELPFGSFATDQPQVDLTIDAPISPLADIGTPLTVFARGGFRYGNDALDNPVTDPSLLSDVGTNATSWAQSASVTPTSLIVTQTTDDNGEGVTGPNWLRTFTINVDIPTGQVLSNFVLTDALPDNIALGQITGVSVGGAANAGVNFTTNVNDTDGLRNFFGQDEIGVGAGVTYDAGLVGTYGTVDPSGPQTGNTLAIVADSDITGYDGDDITVTITYFVPETDANSDYVVGGNHPDSDRGEDDPNSPEISNTVTASGSLAAADARDPGGAIAENATSTLDVRSVAIQKAVSVVGGGVAAPGRLLEWTLSFQLSDYYTYGNLIIDDLLSDGQSYFSDAINRARFSVTDRGITRAGDFAFTLGSVAAAFDGTNTFVVDQSRLDTTDGGPGDSTAGEIDNPTSDGQTAIRIFLSEALIALGDDGILEGDLADDGIFDSETATGTITFYTEVQEDFVDPLSSEDRSVDQGDVISNTATLTADNHVNRFLNPLMPASGHTETDDAAASIAIPVGALTKQLYAINGNTSLGSNLNITTGDRITYRLTYDLPTTDFEDLVLTDFFPLPVFSVADPDGDGFVPADPNDAWVFDADTTSTNMGAGVVEILTTDTFYDIWDLADGGLDDSQAPTLSVDVDSNSLAINFGTFDGTTNSQSQIDLLVTVTVGDTEFADGLFLTNMAQASEASTGGAPSSNVDLVQISLSAPELEIIKGIASTSVDATAVYSTSSVANELQQITGTASGAFTMTLQGQTTAAVSSTADATEIRQALEALSGVEQGDVIVSGGPIGSGSMRIAFVGSLAATDVTFTANNGGLTATELFAGGSAITESSRASVWGLPGAGANTAQIDAATIAALPLDADVDGLDGRDQVKYAITIRNVGGAEAYDISLTDLLPAGLEAAAGGLNLRVYDTDGNELTWTALGADPLADGIRINDSISMLLGANTGFHQLIRMESVDNFDTGSNASVVGSYGPSSLEAMARDWVTGTVFAAEPGRLGTINTATGAFTALGSQFDAAVGYTLNNVDSLAFNPITNELWGLDGPTDRLFKIDTTTGRIIENAFAGGTADYITVSGSRIDDIAIDFSGRVFATTSDNLIEIMVNESAGTATRSVIGAFDYADGGVSLDDLQGLSIDQWGRLWGTTGSNDSSSFDSSLFQIDKATGDVSERRGIGAGGDFEAFVASDPNHAGAIGSAGAANDTLIVTYDVQLADSAEPNTTYTNDVTLTDYTARDGGTSFLTGTPPTESASILPFESAIDTFIVDTSESHTGVTGGIVDATIGEIVRYRVEVELAEGTYNDLTLRELLPTGLTFIDDDTATIAFVSDNDAITSTDISDGSAFVIGNETTLATIDPDGEFGDEDIANSLNGTSDTYNSGTDVYFKLGNVVNADNDANVEYVVIEFNALVDNHSSNDAGDIRSHRSRLFINDASILTTSINANDQVRVVEPQLSVASRVFSLSQVDGGDIFSVTVTLQAASGTNFSDAYDLVFDESIPTGFTRTGSITLGGSHSTSFSDSSTSSSVNLTFDDLPEGDTITITYQVVADDDLPPAGSHPFASDLTWTSLAGDQGDTSGSDPTDSDPPGSPGDIDGERTGDPVPLSQNDYRNLDSDNLSGRALDLTKTLIGTEFANDIDVDGIDDQVVIGELVTYELHVDVPESRANNVLIVDTLDPGLAFVGITSITTTDDLALVGGAAINQANITTTVGPGGQTVTFDIGDIFDPTPLTSNDSDSFTIRYQAVVVNDAVNQGGPSETNMLLNNSAVLSYDGGTDVTRSAINIEVIEPELTTTLDVYGDGGPGDTLIEAGEALTVEFTLSNASGVDAFDVYSYLDLIRLDDGSTAIQHTTTPGLAPTLTVADTAGVYDASDFEWVDPDNTANPGSDAQGWRLQIINPDGFDLSGADPARTITFTVTGTASIDIAAGETYTTDAGATFTSLDGNVADRSTYNTESDERSYDPTMTRLHDDYLASSSSSITMAEPSVTKTLTTTEINLTGNDHTQATIGELVTYTVVITLPQGITNDVVLTDNLDPGLAYVGMVSGSAPDAVTADGKVLTWNLGDLTNDPAIGTDDTITFVYQAVVLDNAANNAGTQIGESAASAALLDFELPDGSAGAQKSDDTIDQVVTLVEPEITVTSSMTTSVGGDQIAEAGEIVTYTMTIENTGTVAAYDTDILLTLPFYIDDFAAESSLLRNISFVVDDSIDVYDDAGNESTPGAFFDLVAAGPTGQRIGAGNTVDIDLDPIAGRTITITVTGTVIDDVAASDQFRSWHEVDWTSMNGLDDVDRSAFNNDVTERAQEREFDPLWVPDDYRASRSEFLSTPNPTLDKSLTTTEINSAANDHTRAVIGELVTYTLTVDLTQGITHNVALTDVIDAGMALHDVVSTSHAPVSQTLGANNLSWNFGDITNDPTNPTDDQLTVVYRAVVLDVVANQAGTQLGESPTDRATLTWDDDGIDNNNWSGGVSLNSFNTTDHTTDQVVTIVEPTISVARDAYIGVSGITTGDAGDTVTYVVTLTNASGVDAYDLAFSDVLPSLVAGSAVLAPNFTITGNSGASVADFQWTASSSDINGWELEEVPTADIDLLAGRTLTITISGTLSEDVRTGEFLSDDARVRWTSIDDNVTSDEPPTIRSVYHADSRERTGDDGPAGVLDNYAHHSSDSISINYSSFIKQIFATDVPETGLTRPGGAAAGDDPLLEDVAIGEYITYRLVYTAAEGVSDDLVITDQALDNSTQRLEILSASVVSIGANLTFADNGGSPLNFTGATDANNVRLTISDALYGDGINDTFIADLGDLSNASDGLINPNDQIVIDVIARVADVAGNQNDSAATPQHVENNGWYTVRNPNNGTTYTSTLQTVEAEIVTPDLSLTKSFDRTLVDTGETVTVTLTATNNGNASAYQVEIEDVLSAAGFDRTSVNIGTAGVDYPADFTATYVAATGTLTYEMGQLDAGEIATFTFTVNVADGATPGGDVTNLATITTSNTLPDGHPGEPGGRTYGDTNAVDDTDLDDTATFSVRENTIAGYVYFDADMSDAFDAGDTGLAGVTLTLTGTDHLGNAITPVVIVSADGTGPDPIGYYEFTGLAAGTYTVTQTQPTSHLDGEETAGNAATIAGAAPVHDAINFTFATGAETDSTGNHFGEIAKGQIVGYVHHDADLDGDYNGTGGLQDVTVTITYTDDRSVGAVQNVTTDANGRFIFDDLRPGSYTITADSGDVDLTGYLDGIERDDHNSVDSATDFAIGAFTLSHGEVEDDKWFGFNLPGSISGFVYHDADNDAVKDVAELGLANSQVRLTGTTFEGDTITAVIDTTDAAGFYEFTSLLPGTYSVQQIVAPVGHIDGRDTAGDPAANTLTNDLIAGIVLSDNEDSTDNLFGELVAATLTGTVFNDFDGNGVMNGLEVGIAGVTLTLSGTQQLADGSSAAITPIIVNTAADGSYSFVNLRPGTYIITQTHPTTYTDGIDTAGTLGGSTAVNDVISAIVVTSDDDGTGYNFAETGSSISGTVYRDDDRDGVLDGGELGISGVTVELYESDGTTLITTTTTAASGLYTFGNLAAGDYVVRQVQPTQYTSSPAADTNARNITLVTGVDNTDNNFGEALWDLSGRVWFDRDAAGDNDVAEHGFDAVTVTLTYAGADGNLATAGDNQVFMTTTDSNGDYSFAELFNGNYRVDIDTNDLPEGVTNNVDPDGGVPSQSLLTIGGADITNEDFGYLGAGLIGNQLWLDVNGDGVFQSGTEPGLANITVNISFAGDDGVFGTSDDMAWSDVTAADGTYTFANLPDGNYRIAVDTADTDLPDGIAEVTIGDSNFGTVNVTLNAADRIADDIDFAFVGQRSIGDTLWFDIDGDGIQDAGEPGLGGVTVQLTRIGPNGAYTTTTTTAADGSYSFARLAEGSYSVTAIAGLAVDATPTHDVDGTDDGVGSFTIGAANRDDIDFGYRGSGTDGGTISDFVWYDHDNDGVQDAGEPGIEGATVTVTFAGADGIFGNLDDFQVTDTTDVNGQYALTNLFAGDYRVAVSGLPGALTQTFHRDDIGGVIAEVSEISLVADQDRTNIDFGYTGIRSASGQVWIDRNSNDVNAEPNEPGIGGVTVELTYAGADGIFGSADDLTLTTITDNLGNYTFNSLADGDYRVTAIANLPAGSSPTSGGVIPDGIVDFTIAGASVTDQDLGYVGTRTIGDRVWYDVDGDGIQDAGEPGIANVDLTIVYYGADGNRATTTDNLTFNITTGVNGIWSIDGLFDGDYDITLDTADLPAGMTVITEETDDFNVLANNVAHMRINAIDPAVRTDIDFGLTGNQTIGSRVWLDLDADGIVDGNEVGLGDVDVTIVWAGFDNNLATTGDNVTITTTTDAAGNYSIGSLANGNYAVSIDASDLPAGLTQTHELDGSTDNNALLSLSGGGNSAVNFGFRGSSSIGDLVYLDGEADGLQTGQDRGLTDITISLTYLGLDGIANGDGSEFSLSTTSGVLGSYLFDFLPGGNFVVSVDTGDADLPADIAILADGVGGAIGASEQITLAAGAANNSLDFAFAGTRAIGDRVWFDRNDNSVDDLGEPGLVGVDLTLTFAGQDGTFGTADDVTFTTTTGAAGAYSFSNAAAGEYRLAVDTASLPDAMRSTFEVNDVVNAIADTAEFSIAGANRNDIDFGYTGDGVISDRVWLDVDNDGIQDAGEPGLAGVTLTLEFAGDDGVFGNADDLAFTTDTDASGLYSFDHLADGDYRVTVDTADLPSSTVATFDVDGTPNGVANLTLAGSASRTDVDFGFAGTRSMQGQVWLDRNSNDTNGETNEPGLGGVTVELTFAGTDGNFATTADNYVVTTITDASGNYGFNNLADGDYRVTSIAGLPVGLTPTSGGIVPDGIVDFSVAGGNPANQNLGYVGSSTISDLVWFDHDGDGLQNVGTVGLADVEVTLVYTGADGIVDGDAEEFTLVVDSEDLAGTLGRYVFENLPAGTFQVSIDTADVDLPTGLTSFSSPQSVGASTLVNLGVGITNTTTDFGLRGTGSADGIVFFDGDANGVQAASNEDGFVGTTMTLQGAGQDGLFGTGDDVSLVVDTTAGGNFDFTGLFDGLYRVTVDTADVPDAPIQTYDIDGTLNSRGDFALTGTQNNVDFGYRGNSSISDRVWYDANANGTQDLGEVGIANQTVQAIFAGLDGTFGTGDDMTYTTTTNLTGNYSIANLLAGDYRVSVVAPPAGSINTAAPDDGAGVVADTAEVTLATSANRTDVDLGFTGTGSITGVLVYDVNDDGVENLGDRRQGGVEVTIDVDLDGDGNDDFTQTVTTAADGSYSFTNLFAGTHTITVDPATLPDSIGDKPTFDPNGHVATPDTAEVALGAGANVVGQDFGYHGSPDLSVTITDNVTVVGTGQAVTYTIDIENLGTSRASGSQLVVNLPTNVLENIASTDPTAVINVAAGTITFNIGNIPEGGMLTRTVTADVLGALDAGIDDVDVVATITDDGLHGVDDNLTNNANTDTDIVDAVPDLRTIVNRTPPVVEPGDSVVYDVTIHNDGDQEATGVEGKINIDITVIDPASVVFEDTLGNPIPPGSINFNPLTGDITWDAGAMVSGDSSTLIIRADVLDPVASLKTNFEIDVIACDDGTNGEDPTDDNDGPLDNNHAEAFTILNATPEFFVDIEIDAAPDHTFSPSDKISFTITAGNLGSQGGDNVEVITSLPMTLIDPSSIVLMDPAASFNATNGTIEWDLGTVAGRGTDIRTLTVMASIPIVTDDPLANLIEFTSIIFDDGANGPDLILSNNTDVDGRELLQYAFDSTNDFMQRTGFDDDIEWYAYREDPLRHTKPLPVDPIYSGLAEPGTTLVLRIYDDTGNVVGTRTVIADQGGNWIATFPGAVIWEHPHAMTAEAIGVIHTLGEDGQYNTRRYFQPALHPSMFFSPRPTVQSVMQDAPSQVLSSIHQANLRPLQFGLSSHSYDLNVISNSTAGK